MPRSHRLLRSVDARSTAPLRGVGCCGRWRQGPLCRSEAWAVVVGGDKVHRAARRRGLLWSVETRSTVPLGGVGLLWRAETGSTGPLRGPVFTEFAVFSFG